MDHESLHVRMGLAYVPISLNRACKLCYIVNTMLSGAEHMDHVMLGLWVMRDVPSLACLLGPCLQYIIGQ